MPWQQKAVLYPDIELVLTGKIRTALAGRAEAYAQDVYVSNSVPSPRKPRMVIVRRDGGLQEDLRDKPRVTFRVWAATEQDADDLARLVMALVPTFADGSPILAAPSVGRTGPSPVPDQVGQTGQPQRLMSVEFHTRGVVLT